METKAKAQRGRVDVMGRPTLGDDRNATLRRLAEELRDQEFDGVMSHAAKAIGVSPASLSAFLAGGGAGSKITDGLTKHLRRGVDQIMQAGGDLKALRDRPSVTPAAPREVTFRELPNWPSLLAAARRDRPGHAEWVWEELAGGIVWLRGPVTVAVVADSSDMVARHVPPPTEQS